MYIRGNAHGKIRMKNKINLGQQDNNTNVMGLSRQGSKLKEKKKIYIQGKVATANR